MELRFVTRNPYKAQEVQTILGDIEVSIVHAPLVIHEIQTEDIKLIVSKNLSDALAGGCIWTDNRLVK